jgi:nucleoside-diphosphate-sugar epimerase
MKVVQEMQAAGREVRVLDVILHGQEDLADARAAGVEKLVFASTSPS